MNFMFSWQTQYLTSERSAGFVKNFTMQNSISLGFPYFFSETIFIFQDEDCQERKKQEKTGCDLQMKRSQSLKPGSESTNSAWKKFHSFSRLNLFCLDIHTLLDC